MNNFLKHWILIFFILFASTSCFADADDYVFDPLDPHHSMYIPDGEDRFPAILLLHASTGIESVTIDWATLLRNNGYVVYLIDSFKPRGWEDRSSVGWDKATAAQLADVVPAFQYLSSLPYVDPKRIGVLGFSMGGFDVLRIMERNETNPEDFQKIPFKAAASFYGVCHRLAPVSTLRGITGIFIGDKDDRAKTDDCLALVKRSETTNKFVTMKTYENSLHGFDNFEFPVSKEVVDERGEYYHIGYNYKARQLAIQDLLDFFNQNMG